MFDTEKLLEYLLGYHPVVIITHDGIVEDVLVPSSATMAEVGNLLYTIVDYSDDSIFDEESVSTLMSVAEDDAGYTHLEPHMVSLESCLYDEE